MRRLLFPLGPGAAVLLLLVLSALALCGCGARRDTGEGPQITLDGAPWDGQAISPDAGDMRVYVTLDGEALIDLPFGEVHTLTVVQPGTGENTIAFTPKSVYMLSADCENQDCVQMGEVTRENLEARVMGGFIVCLPHRITVEVRGE